MENIRYSKKVMQHFLKPKNFGEIKDADAVGEAGNMKCGDIMNLYLKVKNGKIVDAKFKTFGCAAAIASSDVLCELVKGKTIKQAEKITNKDIVNYLGMLPKVKLHCSVLGMETFHDAIKKLRAKQHDN
jgi:NifU-like protein involved in Fe-S cluster formation